MLIKNIGFIMTTKNKVLEIVVLKNASKNILGGSGNATEFGRPQGRKPGS